MVIIQYDLPRSAGHFVTSLEHYWKWQVGLIIIEPKTISRFLKF
jgi:hypothetical protein